MLLLAARTHARPTRDCAWEVVCGPPRKNEETHMFWAGQRQAHVATLATPRSWQRKAESSRSHSQLAPTSHMTLPSGATTPTPSQQWVLQGGGRGAGETGVGTRLSHAHLDIPASSVGPQGSLQVRLVNAILKHHVGLVWFFCKNTWKGHQPRGVILQSPGHQPTGSNPQGRGGTCSPHAFSRDISHSPKSIPGLQHQERLRPA